MSLRPTSNRRSSTTARPQRNEKVERLVGQYIASFESMGHCAGVDLNDPSNLRTFKFAKGLPRKLAESCIDIEGPETFAQWALAAQNQKNWLRKKSIFGDYDTVPNTEEDSQPKRKAGNAPKPKPKLAKPARPTHLLSEPLKQRRNGPTDRKSKDDNREGLRERRGQMSVSKTMTCRMQP